MVDLLIATSPPMATTPDCPACDTSMPCASNFPPNWTKIPCEPLPENTESQISTAPCPMDAPDTSMPREADVRTVMSRAMSLPPLTTIPCIPLLATSEEEMSARQPAAMLIPALLFSSTLQKERVTEPPWSHPTPLPPFFCTLVLAQSDTDDFSPRESTPVFAFPWMLTLEQETVAPPREESPYSPHPDIVHPSMITAHPSTLRPVPFVAHISHA
mmetsp:Transcript_37739/g.89269  ORF Transcript_37739/g.89269 Transcript_37739/m.89269 type:complete len:215 (+) Transcript_37739:606-1250(+)